MRREVSYHLRDRPMPDRDNGRLQNELGWHDDRGNLLRFLDDPGIEPTNNRAERALRGAVIARKVSHCSKNEGGADAFSAFTSVSGPWLGRVVVSRWWMVCAVCSAARLSTPAPPEPLPHLYASANQLRVSALDFSESSGSGQSTTSTPQLSDAIYCILRSGGSLHRGTIYERLVEMGFQIGGQHPINNMSARLSLDTRFKSLGGGVWTLAESADEEGSQNTQHTEGGTTSLVGNGNDDDQLDDSEEEDVPW